MKPLTSYIVFWKTRKWEVKQTREDVCVFLYELKKTLEAEVYNNVSVVTPQAYVYRGNEFIDTVCESQPSCEMVVLKI